MEIVSLCTSSFLVDLYPYIYEVQQIVAMLDAYVHWLPNAHANISNSNCKHELAAANDEQQQQTSNEQLDKNTSGTY